MTSEEREADIEITPDGEVLLLTDAGREMGASLAMMAELSTMPDGMLGLAVALPDVWQTISEAVLAPAEAFGTMPGPASIIESLTGPGSWMDLVTGPSMVPSIFGASKGAPGIDLALRSEGQLL